MLTPAWLPDPQTLLKPACLVPKPWPQVEHAAHVYRVQQNPGYSRPYIEYPELSAELLCALPPPLPPFERAAAVVPWSAWYCLRRYTLFSTALLLRRFLGSPYHSNKSITSSINCMQQPEGSRSSAIDNKVKLLRKCQLCILLHTFQISTIDGVSIANMHSGTNTMLQLYKVVQRRQRRQMLAVLLLSAGNSVHLWQRCRRGAQ